MIGGDKFLLDEEGKSAEKKWRSLFCVYTPTAVADSGGGPWVPSPPPFSG